MTLESAENKVQYATNGVTQAFSIPFKFLDNSHITVYFKDTGGVVTEPAFGSDFSLSGAGEAEGGTITFGAAPAASGTLTILREVPNTQTLDLENNDPFDANSIERAFDLLTMQVQQAEEKISRAVVLPPTSTDSTPDPGGYIEALEGLATTATTAATTATTAAEDATTAAADATTAAEDVEAALASLAIGAPNGVCPLGGDGIVPSTHLPTMTVEFASEAEALAGTSTVKVMNPATTKAVVDAITPSSSSGNLVTFSRDTRFSAKAVSIAADRYTLLTPNRMNVDVNGTSLSLTTQASLDLSVSATWDSTATDYTVAANRAGKDFYVYACNNSGALVLLVSANATTPTGYTASTSRKIAGFHCLCVAVGTISGHTLTGYLAGDILPASVWDLKHRPICSPEGMVHVAGIKKWMDIYLASVSGGNLVSVYNATCADGTSSPAFHWYKFSQGFGAVGKRLPTQHEFVAASLGSNQGTNIAGSADPGTTGGKSDTAGRRMISNVGCEDCCGNHWQWGDEAGGGAASATWVNAFDGNDAGVSGMHFQAPYRAVLGGSWDNGAFCGSRCSAWSNGSLLLSALIGARGVADHIEEI